VHVFDVLGDPVRRRIIELLATSGELIAGDITVVIVREFGITQPAVSRQLRILREAGFVHQRPEGTRRVYTLADQGFDDAKAWIGRVEAFWSQAFDALSTEIARQNRAARKSPPPTRQNQRRAS
jgi:DNA-binding transcriptional ArsR family regulator